MEKFVGDLLILRDKIGLHLSNHVRELNETHTTNDIARLHELSLGIISNLNTKNYSRISLPTILETAQKLGFVYNFSMSNEKSISNISLTIKLRANKMIKDS